MDPKTTLNFGLYGSLHRQRPPFLRLHACTTCPRRCSAGERQGAGHRPRLGMHTGVALAGVGIS